MNKPEIKIKFANSDLKVLELKGKGGDLLPDHEVNIPAILSVRAGQVKYSQSGSNMKLIITSNFKGPKADEVLWRASKMRLMFEVKSRGNKI